MVPKVWLGAPYFGRFNVMKQNFKKKKRKISSLIYGCCVKKLITLSYPQNKKFTKPKLGL
jgi:hypothetical protein